MSEKPLPFVRPAETLRISNLREIAADRSVNNFARSICAETADFLQALRAPARTGEAPQQTAVDPECICKGNWRAIVKETEALIGKRFREAGGDEYHFFGVVHGDDDYYYGMDRISPDSGLRLLSCVGSLDCHTFTLAAAPAADSLAARLEAAERDAERYRWLNKQHHFLLYIEGEKRERQTPRLRCGEPLDHWLDARIADDAALAARAQGKEW